MSVHDDAVLSPSVNTHSRPSDLKITDVRFAEIEACCMRCILVRIDTNQGISGYGEIRDGASPTYGAMVKSRLLGDNPCDVDRLFRRIKQFGGVSRQGGGVSGIEIALWDLAGKAYGQPVYNLIGGRFRDKIEMYCDMGRSTAEDYKTGTNVGKALKARMERYGFGMCKAVVGIERMQQLHPDEELIAGPPSLLERVFSKAPSVTHIQPVRPDHSVIQDYPYPSNEDRNKGFRAMNIQHPYNFLRITERGLDRYEEYVAQIREVIGYRTPLAIDHLGIIGLEDAAKLLRRLEKYNLTWAEDVLPWWYHDEYVRLSQMTTTVLATGEDAYSYEDFELIAKGRSVAVIHPDICSSGGIYQTKQIGDMAQRNNVAMALHMCETPVAALATAHMGVATENFFAMEFNGPEDPWWDDIVIGPGVPRIVNGTMTPPAAPGLGIDDINLEILRERHWPGSPEPWAPTEQWDKEWSNDRAFS